MKNPILLAGAFGALLLLAPLAPQAAEHEKAAAGAPVAAADTPAKPWNQEEMTTLTGELSQGVRDVRQAWRQEPLFRDQDLRHLDRLTTQLHTRVKAGEGREATQSTARNIGVTLNDLEVNGRRLMTSQWMEARVRPVMAKINEVAAYYGSGPLFDPETGKRVDR